jgi:hypothetical protein
MNANVIEFYKKVRADQGLIDALSEGKTVEEFTEIAVEKAAEIGILLEAADVVAALGQFKAVIEKAANDDELTEVELELVAAGVPPTCIKGNV